jgi:hypothetical protein
MINTDKSSFTSKSDWAAVTESDLVFDGSVTFQPKDEWTVVTFDTPFEYEEGKNVLICINDASEYVNGVMNYYSHVTENVRELLAEIRQAAIDCGRDPADVTLMAVTKTVAPELVNEAIANGIVLLGENRAQELLEKYDELISPALEIVGYNSAYRSGSYMKQLVADLYYEFGLSEWGDQYDIVLGGGFMSVRSPYNLYTGDVMYSDLQSLFPFDNRLTLCAVKGKDLKSKFFYSNNDRYYISYGTYGNNIKDNIDPNATYYIVTDTYTSQYKYNNLTEIARYDETTFARDLLADYIKEGGLA